MNLSTAKKLIKINKKLYESQALAWSKTRHDIWEKPLIDTIKYIKPNNNLLDLGCGNARLYQLLVKKKINYIGIDPSKSLISLNKSHYSNAQFKVGDGLKLHITKQFDYIFSIAVLHHIPGSNMQEKFLSNCLNALKDDGTLVLTVWNRYQNKYKKYFKQKKLYKDMQPEDLLVPWKNTGYYRFIHAFNANELAKIAQKVGFKKIKCYYIDKISKSNRKNGLNILLIAKK